MRPRQAELKLEVSLGYMVRSSCYDWFQGGLLGNPSSLPTFQSPSGCRVVPGIRLHDCLCLESSSHSIKG